MDLQLLSRIVRRCAEKSIAPALDEIEKFRVDHSGIIVGLKTKLDHEVSRIEEHLGTSLPDLSSPPSPSVNVLNIWIASEVALIKALIWKADDLIKWADDHKKNLLSLPQLLVDFLRNMDIPVVKEFSRDEICLSVDSTIRRVVEATDPLLEEGITETRDQIEQMVEAHLAAISRVLTS